MSSRAKRATKLDRLLAQGKLVEAEIDGQRVSHFAMPTPALQSELDEALEKQIKKQLKSAGWKRRCATNRDHPFYSPLLIERMDKLVEAISWSVDLDCLTEEGAAKAYRSTRRRTYELGGEVIKTSKEQAEATVDRWIKKAKAAWAEAVSEWRSMIADPAFHQGTYVQKILCPDGAPRFTDKPPPQVFVKQGHDLVLSLARKGWVNLWVRSRQTA